MRTLTSTVVPLLLAVALSGCVRRVVLMPPAKDLADPPPGMVDVNVVSDDGRPWRVRAGAEQCVTPCSARVSDAAELQLTSKRGDVVLVPALAVEAPNAQHAMVVAEGVHRGKNVNGIVFTTLGGMALVTAITLTAVGCSNMEERSGLCTAGLVVGGIALPLTALAIWLIVDAQPKAHVIPIFKTEPKPGQTPVTVTLTPAGLAGTF